MLSLATPEPPFTAALYTPRRWTPPAILLYHPGSMTADPPSRLPPKPLPPDMSPDALTRYIYRYFSHLLTDEERAAERVRTGRAKQLWSSNPDGTYLLNFFRVPEVQAKFPDLMRRIDNHGLANVMRAAADRVLRDNPDQKIQNMCEKCGELCLTPKAQNCFACGFDWHP